MKVILDTGVMSLGLRRSRKDLSLQERQILLAIRELIGLGLATIIGPVRQELLSGIRDHMVFERIRDHLRAFSHPDVLLEDFEEAAACRNRCISSGIGASATDMLICAIASRLGIPIFSLDKDFTHYATCLPIRLVGITELQQLIREARKDQQR